MPVGIENLNLIPEETRKVIYDASRRAPEGYENRANEDNKDGPRQQVCISPNHIILSPPFLRLLIVAISQIASKMARWWRWIWSPNADVGQRRLSHWLHLSKSIGQIGITESEEWRWSSTCRILIGLFAWRRRALSSRVNDQPTRSSDSPWTVH